MGEVEENGSNSKVQRNNGDEQWPYIKKRRRLRTWNEIQAGVRSKNQIRILKIEREVPRDRNKSGESR